MVQNCPNFFKLDPHNLEKYSKACDIEFSPENFGKQTKFFLLRNRVFVTVTN